MSFLLAAPNKRLYVFHTAPSQTGGFWPQRSMTRSLAREQTLHPHAARGSLLHDARPRRCRAAVRQRVPWLKRTAAS